VAKSGLNSEANPQQLEAITSTEGPLLIIAGPGSGKTFTLVERVVSLLTEKSITPDHIMVVTFTDKAAQELTTRISNRLDQLGVRFNLNEMYLGTFHSICLRWLQDNREFTRLKHNFTVFDEFDQHYFIYQRFSAFEALEGIAYLVGSPDNSSTWDRSEVLVKWINTVAEESLDIKTLLAAPDEAISALGRCAQLYRTQLEENNALDFSTIQSEALQLLRDYPSVRDALKEQIAYVMVDEYQDTNTIQERILLELVGTDSPNLCVVGDDDQGIYRFRGATIRNILQFGSTFTGPRKQVALEINYRSHQAIIEFCARWMAGQEWTHQGQQFRYHKQIVPRPAEFPPFPAVVRVPAKSDTAWQEEVLDFLQALRTEGHLADWNQAAFLFRSVKNPKVRALATYLEEHGIPVYSPRANQFFDREEVRLMIGALIFLFPQFFEVRKWRADAHLAIWDYYDNECFAAFADALRKPENADLWRWARLKAKQHRPLVENADYAFSGLFFELLRFPLFSCYLEEDLLKEGLQQSRAMRNLGLFSQLLNKFEYLHHITVLNPEYLDQNLQGLFNRFLRFLKDGGINEYEDEAEYAPSGYVSFLTIHQAKGLEFPVVLVDSLSAVPRKQYTEIDEKLEQGYLVRPPFEPLSETKHYDFRRLYYTAFSRAQNLLVLSASEKEGYGRTPSAYFKDYYQGLPSWRDPALRLAELPLETVKQANLKREYSFTSHITVYENCAEQYRFFRELDFAPVRRNAILFGTLVHQTIEDIHRTVLRGEQDRLSEDRIRTWFDTNYALITQRERVYLAPYARNLAVEQVLRYYNRQNGNWSHIRQAEVDVSLVKEHYILAGKVDLIAGQHDTVELVDFKSERKLDVNDLKDRDKLNQYRRQLEVYAHIVEQRTGQKISKTHLYYTSEESGSPYITFTRDGRSIEQTIQTFDTVVGRIEARDFAIPARPTKLCRECDMRHYCDAKNWKFRSTNI
jgi:DNA helicase-2/ATP-dependent DNA helicase PcrA